MEAIDDDFFSDDGFDDLSPDALLQLEQDAFRATQAENLTRPEAPTQSHWASRDVVDQDSQTGAVRRPGASTDATAPLRPPAHLHTGLTSDYGALDVGELDAEVIDSGPSPAALNQAIAFSEQRSHYPDDTIVLDEEEPMQTGRDPSLYSTMHKEYAQLTEKLQQENERYSRLEAELATAKSMAETKAGEAAIIRSKQAKLIEDYERQIATLRKVITEEMAKYREEADAARAEGRMLATENAFLRQDLAEEALRTNQLRVKVRAEEKEPPITPRKTKVLPFRDGFDDDEILAASPSKSGKSKRTTPTVSGKKRRRTSQGSPTPLRLSPRGELPGIEAAEESLDEAMLDVAVENVNAKEPAYRDEHQSMRVVKRILNHRTYPHNKPDLEVMAELAFPSEPERTLSSILLEETARLNLESYAVEHLHAIMSLWSRALKEQYYQPIPMFLEIVQFVLSLDEAAVLGLIDRLLPLLQDSGDVNGIPRFKHSPVSRQSFGQLRQTPISQIEPLVDSTEALRVMYQMACRSLSVDRDLENFWRHMRYDFVLMMLNCFQRITDISLTLSLLITSVRGDSFGSIQETEQDQNANENYIVDRVANLLSETPQPDEGQPPYTRSEICDLRLEALSFLMTVAFNPIVPASSHGSLVIASHPTALARLIRAMHDELDALYSFPPERDMHASLVNNLMRLIYSVVRRHPEEVDLQSKLYRVAGGKQKFLVVLTRLAFSEGLVLESGIEDETVEMAHEILDDAVNPQEAEALLDAFPHAKWEDTEMTE
ncbi:putative DNA repair protein Rad26 [Aspergillus lucknowensis]|uniref:DNA repair protein Rad26 n=1 Tax=Aspergillus lucknowensis TaxID=176173 RepID=A0ABR4LGF0_9EURO